MPVLLVADGALGVFSAGLLFSLRCLLLAVLLVAPPLFARELHILNFHADLVVLPDSTLDVTETIRVEFMRLLAGPFPHDSRGV